MSVYLITSLTVPCLGNNLHILLIQFAYSITRLIYEKKNMTQCYMLNIYRTKIVQTVFPKTSQVFPHEALQCQGYLFCKPLMNSFNKLKYCYFHHTTFFHRLSIFLIIFYLCNPILASLTTTQQLQQQQQQPVLLHSNIYINENNTPNIKVVLYALPYCPH